MRIIAYDFEIYQNANWWCVCFIDLETRIRKVIVNDPNELRKVYMKNKDSIWLGYNSRAFDQWVFKGILLGLNPCDINFKLITLNQSGYSLHRDINKIQFYNFDIMTTFDGLKKLEGYLGENIKETSVPFDYEGTLTEEQEQEIIDYCFHDVEMTIKVFELRTEEFDAQLGLIEAFNLDMSYFNKTKAQLSAHILGASKVKRDDEFDITIVDCLRLEKYKHIEDWFRNPANLDYSNKLKTEIYGGTYVIGFGGIHHAIPKYQGEGFFVMSDIASMYPATMLNFGFLSRNVADPEKYRQIRDERIVLKRNKDARQGAYKIVLNSTYGASKDQYNPLYDPLMANNVCINGQLLLVDLLEKLEMKFGNKCLPINVNTDGILVKLESPDLYEEYLSVCKEWENRTGYELEHDLYKRVIGKDVNNYIIIDNDGNIKAKGAFVKKLSKLDYDLPILNKALKEYYINGVPVEETINNCDELIEFQKIVKISNKYLYSTYGDFPLKERMLRVFASTRPYAKGVFKAKQKGDAVVLEKIANTPEKCFIYNENVIGMKVTEELDKQYYINEAKKRIKSFTNEII